MRIKEQETHLILHEHDDDDDDDDDNDDDDKAVSTPDVTTLVSLLFVLLCRIFFPSLTLGNTFGRVCASQHRYWNLLSSKVHLSRGFATSALLSRSGDLLPLY